MIRCGLVVGLLALGVSCAPCVEPKRDLWCHHDASAGGPSDDTPCAPPLLRDRTGALPTTAFACGPYLAWGVGSEASGTEHYFRAGSGAHVATRQWRADEACDDGFWYGRAIGCTPRCAYGDHATLPRCPDTDG